MNILDNELVRKYFGSDHNFNCDCSSWEHRALLSESLITAMQQPIRKGDRALEYFVSMDKWQEIVWSLTPSEGYHPVFLRLPDRFQGEKECDCPCHTRQGCGICYEDHRKPQPEAEKCEGWHNSCVACLKCLACKKCICKPADPVALARKT